MSKRLIEYKGGQLHFNGLRLSVDPLLPVVILIMAWVLSERYYPGTLYLESSLEYWLLGGFTALFITVSIVIHEIGHSVMATWLKIPIERVHLYLFGGMAELKYRPQRPVEEFFIALAGPAASFTLALFSYFCYAVLLSPDYLIYYFFQFLALINLLITLFNLLPIFPLDGGRIVRAVIWKLKKNYIKASSLTHKGARIFIAFLLIMTLIDYFIYDSGYAFVVGILALYMMYTHHNGRGELKYEPELDDLIYIDSEIKSTDLLIDFLQSENEIVIADAIIPVIEDAQISRVIDGVRINGARPEDGPDSLREMTSGDYIDPLDQATFDIRVRYRAGWVPVIQDGEFVGMCDAREMRFWLLQK